MKAALLAMLATTSLHAADPAATAINELGLDLHRLIAGKKAGENLCLSPYSIQCALAMTYAGADGETREEMRKVLHYPAGDAIHEALPKLNQALNGITERTTKLVADAKRHGGDGAPITFNLANRLFGAKGYAFRGQFLNLVKEAYRAPLEPTDFSKFVEATKHINTWVAQETKDRIKDLIPDGLINAGTRLVLVNAVYLKAPWAEKFYEQSTKPEPFHLADGGTKNVPTMMRQDHFGYAKRDGYAAVTIPYYGGDIHFLALVPDDPKGLADLEKKITAEDLASCANLGSQDVILHLPKFKIEGGSITMSGQFDALGMKTAFDHPPRSANFDRMAPRTPSEYLYISEIVHQTFIALDEKGTEAAAATAVVIAPGAAAPREKPKPIELKIDRPFLFAIQHRATGACLFLGRVTEPK